MRAVVEKERRVFLWRGLRIHLDRVAGLDAFLELEAVVEPGSDLAVERARVEHLQTAFRISSDRLVAASYADLVLDESAETDGESNA